MSKKGRKPPEYRDGFLRAILPAKSDAWTNFIFNQFFDIRVFIIY